MTLPQLDSNFNAPSAVVRAAVMYVFRTLVDDDIPMNEGCLKPIELRIPQGCMLNPVYPAAVVAGNVETSQVVTDALYGALQVPSLHVHCTGSLLQRVYRTVRETSKKFHHEYPATNHHLMWVGREWVQVMGASQGTMNNVTFGNERHQYYETVCGGSGAGPDFDGTDAVHTHMTNSRMTDPEV